MYKCVMFDLDGTLLNTLQDIAFCTNQVMKNHGFPESPLEKYNYFVGDGIRDMVKAALPRNKQDYDNCIAQLTEEFRELYKLHWADKTHIYQGIYEMLIKLNELNISICILSNKPDDFTKEMVGHFFRDFPFIAVRGKQTRFPLKPAPDSALDLIKKHKFSRKEVLYVGDTSIDMKTAENCDFTAVGVSWGFRTIEELKSNGANYIAHQPEDIIKIIKEDS